MRACHAGARTGTMTRGYSSTDWGQSPCQKEGPSVC